MSGPNWNALMQAPNAGVSFTNAFQAARKLKVEEARQAEDRAWTRKERARKSGEWQREDDYRGATAELMLGGGHPAPSAQPMNALMRAAMPQATGTAANPAQVGSGAAPQLVSPQIAARERAIRADPEAYLTFQGKQLEVTGKQLKNYIDVNNAAMQLLGGVVDQPTYEAAKARAAQLYSAFGQRATDFFDRLPAEYSPELVESLRLQGMDTSKQMAAIARENRLEWDIADDEIDNSRADRSLQSLDTHRRETRNRPRSTGGGRRGSSAPKQPGSEGALYADIMRRWTQGENVNGREREFVRAYEQRRGKGGGGKRARPSDGRAPTAVGPNGERAVYRGGRWVDERTGRPIQ